MTSTQTLTTNLTSPTAAFQSAPLPVLTLRSLASLSSSGNPVVLDPSATITEAGDPNQTSQLNGLNVLLGNASLGALSIQGQTNSSAPIAGVSWAYNATTGLLSLQGTATLADYQSLLRQVTYTPTSGNQSQQTIDINLGRAIYFAGTGHYYEFVKFSDLGIDPNNPIADGTDPSAPSWTNAEKLAAARTSLGYAGYLATLTSAAEDNFVKTYLQGPGGTAWFGASDAASEGSWRWVTGPEGLENGGLGRLFWQNGSVTPGGYAGWAPGQPNNYFMNGVGQDYGEYFASGEWDDGNNTPRSRTPDCIINGFIVEYGGLASDPTQNKTHGTITLQKSIPTPDLLLRSATSGNTVVTNLVQTQVVSGAATVDLQGNVIQPGANWQIIGTADMNGDGRRDIAWWNRSTSETAVWFMGGTLGNVIQKALYIQLNASDAEGFRPGTNWQPILFADLVGDSKPDILWLNNSDGSVGTWDLSLNGSINGSLPDSVTLTGSMIKQQGQTSDFLLGANTPWRAIAGNFDGNTATHELFWYNSVTSDIGYWSLNGSIFTASPITNSAGAVLAGITGYRPVATGDINGDGKDDIVFQKGNSIAIWTMSGSAYQQAVYAFDADSPNTIVAGLADIDLDGTLDMVVRNQAQDVMGVYFLDRVALAPRSVDGFRNIVDGQAIYKAGLTDYELDAIADFGGQQFSAA